MRAWKSGLRALAAAAFAVLAIQGADARAGSPFAPLAGVWTGSGTIDMPSGSHERIRCRASYVVSPSGTALNQVMRCASDSYQVNIQSDVAERGGAVSGTWAETTRGATGTLAGVVHGGTIQGTISGVGFTATLLLVTHGRTQLISIRLNSAEIAGVTVSFHRW
jgi:hypothetical protein